MMTEVIETNSQHIGNRYSHIKRASRLAGLNNAHTDNRERNQFDLTWFWVNVPVVL